MHLKHFNTTTNTTSLFLSFFLDDLLSFCTFLASHPLPFAYLLFFSPRILSLLSFLSPLLLSTTLLLLTFTTPSPHVQHEEPTLHPPKFLGKTCAIALQLLNKIEVASDDIDDPIGLVEHLDWIVLSPGRDAPSLCFDDESSSTCKVEEKGATAHSLEESKDAKLSSCNEHISENASRATESCDDLLRSCSIRRRALHTRAASEGVRREGSMRKEREWKRTLACKLYEERITFKLHDERAVDVKGGEEMDLLWEAYEVNASKINNGRKKEKKGVKDERKKELKAKAKAEAEAEAKAEEEDDEEEEEDGSVRQLCCLKALKLSAGNMNLGVGRPNLMKISKVLKGMRMFQHFGKHSRKK